MKNFSLEIKQFINAIERNDLIVIFGHLNPDGDCFCSQVALKNFILDNFKNKNVYIVGSGLRGFFDLLDTTDVISDDIVKKSLGIIVDTNTFGRVEDGRVHIAKELIVFDHHLENPDSKDIIGLKIVDSGSVATCDLLSNIIFESKLGVSPITATALLGGIISDSGRFMYSPTNADAFITASKLINLGADISQIYSRLYRTNEKSLLVKGYILNHYQKTRNGVIYYYISQEAMQNLGVDEAKASALVNLLANVDGYHIWASFVERRDGRFYAEIRSDSLSIQQIAVKYGGGGHALASGATLDKKDLIYKMLFDLDDLLEKNKE